MGCPNRTNIAELLADERCSQAVPDFLATTDVGRTAGPPVENEEDDAASAASEWEARERAERDWESVKDIWDRCGCPGCQVKLQPIHMRVQENKTKTNQQCQDLPKAASGLHSHVRTFRTPIPDREDGGGGQAGGGVLRGISFF